MSLKSDLIAARALIDTPEKWIKHNFNRNDCYCAVGALRQAIGGTTRVGLIPRGPYHRYSNAHVAVGQALPAGERGGATFNDDPATSHADILALFDRAIANAEPSP